MSSPRKWYLATCVVRLGATACVNDTVAQNAMVTGYAINIGVSGVDLVQAMSDVERIALLSFDGRRDGNVLEEVKIKEAPLTQIREELCKEEKLADGATFFRSAVMYFEQS